MSIPYRSHEKAMTEDVRFTCYILLKSSDRIGARNAAPPAEKEKIFIVV
jgi:hypothetical protein